MELMRIHEQPMFCPVCGFECIFDDCEPDCDGDGSPGCPQPDCGTIMQMRERSNP